MTQTVTDDPAKKLLFEALDLCVRARKMDAIDRRQATLDASSDPDAWQADCTFDRYVTKHNARYPDTPIATRSATVALWMEDQYARDLADWERRARDFLTHGRTP